MINTPGGNAVFYYSAAQARELDRLAIAGGLPGATLMRRAGTQALRTLRFHWPRARRIAVLCGSGNNGGDGYVLAAAARAQGLDVRLIALGEPRSDEARRAREEFRARGGREEPLDALDGPYDVLVDGLLGTGLARAPHGEFAQAIARANQAGGPVLALDIPSGLDADTGHAPGAVIGAQVTVSFIARKLGLYTGVGPQVVGRTVFVDLGVEIPRDVPAVARALVVQRLPRAPRDAHKGMLGRVLVIGGNHGMAGAAALAGGAALRTGAGIVRVATRREHVAPLVARQPELLVNGVEDGAALRALLGDADMVAIGPGLGQDEWARGMLAAVFETAGPLVVDADALNLLAREPQRREAWILTPHPGEAGRLLGADAAAVQRDRPAAVRELVRRYGGVCVLKGAGTLVGDEATPLALCPWANPGLASAGTGDVLTGMIAGLWARGLAPRSAAETGVWRHARAARQLVAQRGEAAMGAGDLLDVLADEGPGG